MILAYVWMVLCSICFLWYCAMHIVLCSNSMLSGCSSSSLRHFWVVPCGRIMFYIILSVLQNIVMDLNNIMLQIINYKISPR